MAISKMRGLVVRQSICRTRKGAVAEPVRQVESRSGSVREHNARMMLPFKMGSKKGAVAEPVRQVESRSGLVREHNTRMMLPF